MTAVQAGSSRPGKTPRGERTHARLLAAAEQVFADMGYHDASIVKITEAAGVAQGTFYLYFSGKLQIFEELVDDLNRRVRHAMSDGSAAGADRIDSERRGFEAFFRFTAEHPALYRIIRQAEFVSPAALRRHYSKIVEGYTQGLTQASAAGQIADDIDPVVAAWGLMGIGELIGMRWVLWDDAPAIPPAVFEEVMRFVQRALGARDVPGTGTPGLPEPAGSSPVAAPAHPSTVPGSPR